MKTFVQKNGQRANQWPLDGQYTEPQQNLPRRHLLRVLLFPLLLCPTLGNSAPLQEEGIILYTEPPSSYVEFARFTSIERGNIEYSTAKNMNGEDFEIPNSGLIAILYDPPSTPASQTRVPGSTTIAQASTLARRYPEYSSQLRALSDRWQHFTIAERRQVSPPASQTPPNTKQNQITEEQAQKTPAASNTSLSFITKGGDKYDEVEVTKVDPDKIEFKYADGVATVDFEQLPPDIQKRFGYDANKAKAAREELQNQQTGLQGTMTNDAQYSETQFSAPVTTGTSELVSKASHTYRIDTSRMDDLKEIRVIDSVKFRVKGGQISDEDEDLFVSIPLADMTLSSVTFPSGDEYGLSPALPIKRIGEKKLIDILETYLRWSANVKRDAVSGGKVLTSITDADGAVTFVFRSWPDDDKRPISLLVVVGENAKDWQMGSDNSGSVFSPELGAKLLDILKNEADVLAQAAETKKSVEDKKQNEKVRFDELTK